MLFNENNSILRIEAVEHMSWRGGRFEVSPRGYSSITFRIKGSAVITSGGKKYEINTNDILYLPQNTAYSAEYTDTEMIALHFTEQREDGEIEVFSYESGERMYKMFLQAHAVWQNKEAGYYVSSMAQLYGILDALVECKTKIHLPEHFLKAVSYINGNYRNSRLSMETVCAYAGIGGTVFRQLFRKYYEKPPIEYVTELRLEYARKLIAGGESIENAAYESGFSDPKYLARVVKNHYGCTPRQLKNYGK